MLKGFASSDSQSFKMLLQARPRHLQRPPRPRRHLQLHQNDLFPFSNRLPAPVATPPAATPKKKAPVLVPLDVDAWEHETIGRVFNVTLERQLAEGSGYDVVWLKPLAVELESESPDHVAPRLSTDIADRLLIARLELDPGTMSDDLEFLPVLASLPPQQTVFEYLVGCWKRSNATRSALMKKNYSPIDLQNALRRLDKIHELIISYTGLTLQETEMFPQPTGRPLGPPELVAPLLSLSALSAPLLAASSSSSPNTLTPSDIGSFLQDLARRFEPDNEIDGVLGPVVTQLLFHESLFRPEGLLGGDSGWRGVIGGLDALVSIKPIAAMITRLETWNPENATAATIEHVSLMGPLCRLGIFGREWPSVAQAYFTDPEKRSRDDVNSSFASLRGSMKSLQSSLFRIFNILVRASNESREAVLDYFARVISLNVKRAGMQVEPETVATDSFMVNMQSVLLCFAENFIDAKYEKMDRIDPLFYARSSRIDLKDETRIKATSEEAATWAQAQQDPNAPAPNFVSNVFYLTIAMSHYGILRTISTYTDFGKHIDELQRHLDMINADTSWQGTPFQAQGEAAVNRVKTELAKIRMQQLSYEAQLLDPELVFRSITFTNFLSTWLIRQAEPNKRHPNPPAQIPLPQEVPMAFRVLPEYIVEDIVDYLHFVVQFSPDKFELSGKIELLTFVLTFLNSTWYIKNPFLKSKINDVLFFGIWNYGRERHGLLGGLLNTNEMALKHLMPALTHFYIEVEQTGASSQFYDKFSARRNISYILKVVWDNPTHRAALNAEAAQNVDKFVKFVNLMINDVTYLMDESLSELTQIHTIQQEMEDRTTWDAQPQQHRREREGTLRNLERHASGYISLGRSTVELLKVFTAELKGPFMMPEIVNKLAAMLDYNLQALVGPKYGDLAVRDREKLKFNPRALLSDIIQVFLNLSDREEFVDAVASDGRSYSAALFEQAATIALRRTLKTEGEIAALRAFIVRVEERKATMEAEEDFDDIPEEFQDPLMYHLMRDPVMLPTSRTIIDRATIKSHLLSDSKDPFNRQPLAIEQIVPEPELKARIEAWVAEQRKRKQEAAASNAMDTT
ncbi:U-box domain-containing protein [Mycena chlorophos]|uniref:RING-type E3 ubiquitin transferase n=1 Tax=Mycena chlorophos TaxID=658473 RepID=A0A8H6RXP3_MYCCL|nr:U-box domain-containing protein [Mycena chlorophos]